MSNINTLKRIKTYDLEGHVTTHVEGPGDGYTLCGFDFAGDDSIHRKPPEVFDEKLRLTCQDCKRVVAFVKIYLNEARP